MIGLSIIFGLNSASSTMISHAIGAKNFRLSDVYLMRGKIMIIYGMIPVVMMTFFSDKILILIGQNPDVSQ
jgi:Na+-driven multidrug efflux pump